MKKYDHKEIEKKWQKAWDEQKIVRIDKDDGNKEKFYVLDMFPYPSGDGLHMGHAESYTSTDIIYRYKRMKGYHVLHPQGFDAFGLPAENYAIQTGVHPKETTKKNIKTYIEQMKSLGFGYDFDEAVVTSDPAYYKWTQWIFTKFFESGLAYKKTDMINWCESCKTGLANEQVEGGKCERCKNEVMQKEVPGWFFKITDFADDLIEGLDNLDWPEHTKKNQVNWVGRSEGAEIEFKVSVSGKLNPSSHASIGKLIKEPTASPRGEEFNFSFTVFTTRPDTLLGATYCVLAPEHKLVGELKDSISNWGEVEKYLNDTKRKTERERVEAKEKTGIELKGIKAINPANQEEIPIFIADYVLAHYGTGAIMAVPAHDERDFEFAKKFELPIKNVIEKSQPNNVTGVGAIIKTTDGKFLFQERDEHAPVAPNEITFFSGAIEDSENPREAIKRELQEELDLIVDDNQISLIDYVNHVKTPERVSAMFFVDGVDKSNLNLHEGRSIVEVDSLTDILSDKRANIYALEFIKHFTNNLKNKAFAGAGVLVNSGKFDGMRTKEAAKEIAEFVGGKMTNNYRLRDWSISRQRYWGAPIPIVYDPEGNSHAVPEEHLPWALPEDVDFVPTGTAPLAQSKELRERTEKIFGKGWTPETDTMDTFVCSAWYYLRYPDPRNEKEFCSRERLKHWLPVDLYIGGAEHTYMHLLYARFFTKAMQKMGLLDFSEPFHKLRHQGMVLDEHGVKMSKSKGNVVNPNDMIERFGADAARLYIMFAGPLDEDVVWNENGVVGAYRFLEKVWRLQNQLGASTPENIERELHRTIKKVGDDMEELKFNTAIASMMSLMNVIGGSELSREDYGYIVKLIAPFAPHIAEELWRELGHETSIHLESWPEYDAEKIKAKKFKLIVQVNGKVRDIIETEMGTSEQDAKDLTLKRENVTKWIGDELIKKVIFVPNKLINILTDSNTTK